MAHLAIVSDPAIRNVSASAVSSARLIGFPASSVPAVDAVRRCRCGQALGDRDDRDARELKHVLQAAPVPRYLRHDGAHPRGEYAHGHGVLTAAGKHGDGRDVDRVVSAGGEGGGVEDGGEVGLCHIRTAPRMLVYARAAAGCSSTVYAAEPHLQMHTPLQRVMAQARQHRRHAHSPICVSQLRHSLFHPGAPPVSSRAAAPCSVDSAHLSARRSCLVHR
ncbi:hypothetical protein C8J57DRAFT_243564 [Mycena rebaudengoi]|nr:hypothetical protein C8J57DRAFT_243564 [Mycena rebaudengoi]